MSDDFKRMEDKIDVITEKVHDIDKTLIKQHASLETHIKRSDTLEALYDSLKQEIEPMKKHVNYVEGVTKFLAAISMISGIVYTALKLLGKI